MSTSSLSDDEFAPQSVQKKVSSALELKEQGNATLKNNVFEAHELYTKALKEISSCFTDGAETLTTSLKMNLSLTALKLGKNTEAIKFATEVLQKNPGHAKSLFRRGQAYLNNGDLDEAKADLLMAAQVEPANAAVRQSLAEVRQALLVHKEASRVMSTNIFSKGASLYADREESLRRRQEEARVKEEKERAEWEAAKEAGETEDTFESWRLSKHPPAPTPSPPPPAPKPIQKRKKKEESESEEYDEEERRIIAETRSRGYCYFRRNELTEAEVELKKLKPERVTDPTECTPDSHLSGGPSHWNAGGTTWEEKDVTDAAKSSLTAVIESVEFSEGPLRISVTKICSCKGEASRALVRGTPRFIYDFDEVELSWKIREGETDVVEGTMTTTDLSSCRTSDDTEALLHCMK